MDDVGDTLQAMPLADEQTCGVSEGSAQGWAGRRSLVVWVLLALGLPVLLAAWAASSPVGSAPDDDFHLASIWCAADRPGPECDKAGQDVGGVGPRLVPEYVTRAACYAFKADSTAECQRANKDNLIPGRANAGSYPPMFYRALHPIVGRNFDGSVLSARVLNGLIGSALIIGALVLARPRLRRATALSWMLLLVPLGAFTIPSTNPSSWAFIGVGTYWAFIARYLEGPGKTASWSGGFAALAAALALCARTDAAAYVFAVTGAVVILTMPGLDRSGFRSLFRWRLVLPGVIAALALAVFLTSSSASAVVSGATPLDGSEPGRSGFALLAGNIFSFPNYLLGEFGLGWGLGWLDTPMPAGVGAATVSLTVAVVLLAINAFWPAKALATGLIGLAVVLVPLWIMQTSHAFVGEIVQPRYTYPLLVVLIGMTLFVHESKGPDWRLGRAAAVIAAVTLSLANSIALHTNLRRNVTGLDVRRLNLDVGVEWWWHTSITPNAVWAIGTLAGLVTFGVLAHVSDSPGASLGFVRRSDR